MSDVQSKRIHKPPAQREAEILAAAALVFAESGFRTVEVQAIADRAGVGKGTIYRYFPSKEKLFLAALQSRLDRLRDRVTAASDPIEDPLEKIVAALRAYVHFFDEHPETVELFIQERAEFRGRVMPLYFVYTEAHRDEWASVMQALADSGRMKASDVETAVETIGYLLYGFVLSKTAVCDRTPLSKSFDDVLHLVLHGLLLREASDAPAPRV